VKLRGAAFFAASLSNDLLGGYEFTFLSTKNILKIGDDHPQGTVLLKHLKTVTSNPSDFKRKGVITIKATRQRPPINSMRRKLRDL
jgi:hypothetical protein